MKVVVELTKPIKASAKITEIIFIYNYLRFSIM
jgi:hypothetical protein